MNYNRRKTLHLIAAAVAGSVALPASLHAQEPYPTKLVTMVVPFTAGSTTDVVGRVVGERLANYLGQSVIVDNRPGAGGTLGAGLVAASVPDGHTLLVHSAGHVANAALYPSLKYDTMKDFTPVTMLATMPNVLVVAPDKGYASLKDLVEKVKAAPGKFTYASSGNGSASHIAGEKFRLAVGLEVTHVPYRGTPQGLNDVMGGRVDWFMAPLAVATQLIAGGKLQALAIGSAKRSPLLPNVPTTTEAGFPGADYTFWVGLFAPSKIPKPALDRLHIESLRALKSPEVRSHLGKLGAELNEMTQSQFAQFVRDETVETAKLIKQAGIRVD
ncbi:Bug family tripartite tricarboxylate transporter substrate binding protein [Noviherbaspirillum saxi]|uniref:Tripartite tricarboxylate transporter substrate binding protein n=1 Tax=Noviherbaspirillum saxi TaxID=2320863 RepID=A0A3A3FMZ3_9BURK|nr:tripartite tricarboxylate transporter substrate binding protein [Noviherbaspirillum saxi]RJF92715.1 tripartite tricarboxylate transporter substrate binding protein [Noviherbaspirillum saxi]